MRNKVWVCFHGFDQQLIKVKQVSVVSLNAWPCFNRNIITESCLLRYRRLWALSLMTLSLTSPPVSPTCWCTPTWPCGPVQLKGHSCLTTQLQSSLQGQCSNTRNQAHIHKMSHALNICQQPHRHPHHNPRNLQIHHSQYKSVIQHLLNRCPLRYQISLYLQFWQCSQRCPHRLTCRVKQ